MTDFPWRFGANFIPSTAINQLEMWQAETFDPETIDRELGWAAGIGMSIMRVFLHDLLWEQDAEGFCGRVEKYLSLADKHGIKTMFVFFDDCWNTDFSLGKQPDPKPFTHNSGWVQSPGNRVTDDPSQWGRLEKYVRGVLDRFGKDPRIALWDLYNECGNSKYAGGLRGYRSLPLLEKTFAWARAAQSSQPLTACVWNLNPEFDAVNRFAVSRSDVVSFHNYDRPDFLRERMSWLRLLADGRPLLCSEYMARTTGSTFRDCLPLLRENNVSAINWGLVAGKSNTVYPWGWNAEKGNPEKWFHDVFNADGTLLHPEEAEVFRAARATGK